MNKREDALKEALQKNEEETQRWKTYLKENETAIENMSMFSKRLTVDVMVPVGKKAFMPGYLMHTNEVLVGHYQGYFSKCTTYKAKEICELRIKMAKEHLKKLETEAELWQNKLEKPYAEGVVPSGEEREIIEDYNEETEKLWKEQHRLRVKKAKQKEREEREKILQKEKTKNEKSTKEKSDEEIFKMLEEAELMEELEQELDKLEVDEVNDETIRKLMSGEIKLPPEKKRLAHEPKTKDSQTNEELAESAALRQNIIKKNDLKKSTNQINTNNNVQPNPEITDLVNSQEDTDAEDDEDPLPEEVALIKEQAKFLSAEDQIGFYDYQIQIIRQKLQLLPLKTQKELDEKIRLLSVLEHLEELLETAEETVGEQELAEKDIEIQESKNVDKDKIEENPENKEKSDVEKKDTTKTNQKRRISFALEDQTLEFRKHEAVTQMLPPKLEKPQRDIIKLDDDNEEDNETDNHKIDATQNCPVNKKDLIQAKVEQNLQYVAEHQSKQDFDLVNQILQSSMGEIHTLQIKFKHSPREGYTKDNKISTDIPASPADFYDLYVNKQKELNNEQEPSTLFINSYEGEDQVRTPVLKESDRQAAFADPKAEFSNPSKSILKNKSAVDKENHYTDQDNNNNKNKKSKKKSAKKEEDECFSAYYKVMNDVVEKPLTEPDPLPEVKFIDAHAPKKRISRFKQMRKGSETT